MARPRKQTVDYFPHYVKCGRTIFILENKFGNDGYTFWFKLLEILGGSDGHFYDCSNASNWEYLLAKTHVADEKAKDIINVLIDLNKIDIELWNEHRILWIENFVRNLSDVYRTRNTNLPSKPHFGDKKHPRQDVLSEKTQDKDGFYTQETRKEKESREKEREKPTNVGKKKVAADTATTSAPRSVRFIRPTVEEVRAYCTERGNGVDAEAFIDFYESKGWVVGKSPMKDWRAAVRTWEKRDGRGTRKTPAAGGVTLGPGEFIDNNGRRTYGTGKATIPPDAPPRPSERHCWDKATNSWILL